MTDALVHLRLRTAYTAWAGITTTSVCGVDPESLTDSDRDTTCPKCLDLVKNAGYQHHTPKPRSAP